MKPDVVRLMRLVVITGPGGHGRGHEDVARAALAAGCRAVQMRDKQLPDDDFQAVAGRISGYCRRAGALFFVNDRVDTVAAVGCDGVHLGVEDLEVGTARRRLPPGSIIGFSPENLQQAREAVEASADYLGVGPVFATPTKGDAGEPIGLEGMAAYAEENLAPVIAVGGVDEENAASALQAGASGVAVVSAVTGAPDMEAAVRRLLQRLGLDP
jgi:thiamine-phosphate pyrophosphorylase